MSDLHKMYHFLLFRRTWFAVTLILVGFVSVAIIVHTSGGTETVIENSHQLRTWIAENPLLAFVLGTATYSMVSLVPGTGGKAVIAGWLFGLWQGILLVEIALTIAGLITFSISRFVFSELVQSRYAHFVKRIQRGDRQSIWMNLLTFRLAHVPFSLLNIAAGATQVSAITFGWTTIVGLLPGTVVFVFVGACLPSLTSILQEGVWSLVNTWMLVALIMSGLLVPATRLVIRVIKRR